MHSCQTTALCNSIQYSTAYETREGDFSVQLVARSPKGFCPPVDPFLAVALEKCVATYSFDECQDASNHQLPRCGSIVFADKHEPIVERAGSPIRLNQLDFEVWRLRLVRSGAL